MLSESNIPLQERGDISPSGKKLWRVLARVESIGEVNGSVGLVFPSWKSEEVVEFPMENFPVELMSRFKQGYRFHTYANIGTKNASDFYIDINRYEI